MDNQGKAVDLPVYMIHAKYPLSELREALNSVKPPGAKIGLLKIDRVTGNETNRTICVMDSSVYQAMDSAISQGKFRYLPGMSITPYLFHKYLYPKENSTENKNQTDLFIRLPYEYEASYCKKQIIKRLQVAIDFKILDLDDFTLTIPMKSRESDEHRGYCYINFSSNVDIDKIVFTRILVHDTRWKDDDLNSQLIYCIWARQQDNQQESVENGEGPYHKKILKRQVEHRQYQPRTHVQYQHQDQTPLDRQHQQQGNTHHKKFNKPHNYRTTQVVDSTETNGNTAKNHTRQKEFKPKNAKLKPVLKFEPLESSNVKPNVGYQLPSIPNNVNPVPISEMSQSVNTGALAGITVPLPHTVTPTVLSSMPPIPPMHVNNPTPIEINL